jgi:hypothetical protein
MSKLTWLTIKLVRVRGCCRYRRLLWRPTPKPHLVLSERDVELDYTRYLSDLTVHPEVLGRRPGPKPLPLHTHVCGRQLREMGGPGPDRPRAALCCAHQRQRLLLPQKIS